MTINDNTSDLIDIAKACGADIENDQSWNISKSEYEPSVKITFDSPVKLQATIDAVNAHTNNEVASLESRLDFDVYFGKGKVGKGCTLNTLVLRIAAQSKFVDDLIAENDELHSKLGLPSKREQLNNIITAPNNPDSIETNTTHVKPVGLVYDGQDGYGASLVSGLSHGTRLFTAPPQINDAIEKACEAAKYVLESHGRSYLVDDVCGEIRALINAAPKDR